MRSLRSKAIIFGVVLLALYNDWLFGPLLDARMPVGASLISELSAQTQTHHWAFQTLDILAGMLTLAALPWLWRLLRKSHVAYWQILFATIAAIGVDSIVDALLPISCSPSVNAGCNLADTNSLLTDAHMLESTIIGIATFVAPILWWHFCKNKHRFIAQASWWFAILQVAVGVGILLARLLHYDVTGAFQRVYELGIGTWVASILYFAVVAGDRQRPVTTAPKLRPAQPPAAALSLSYETTEE